MGYMRQSAETVFAVFPLLAVGITIYWITVTDVPAQKESFATSVNVRLHCNIVDHKGKAATMLVLGSLLLIACHLTFAFVLPEFKGSQVGGYATTG